MFSKYFRFPLSINVHVLSFTSLKNLLSYKNLDIAEAKTMVRPRLDFKPSPHILHILPSKDLKNSTLPRILDICEGKDTIGLTHNGIVDQQSKKYSKDWIVLKEVSYQGYVFDLLAFNPKTKEIEICEVEFSCAVPKEKLEFAKGLGNVKIFRPYGDNYRVPPKDFQMLIDALGDPVRVAIVETLCEEGNLTHANIFSALKMQPLRDSGKFGYHLRVLLKSGLIFKTKDEKYGCSEKGARIIEFFRKLNTK